MFRKRVYESPVPNAIENQGLRARRLKPPEQAKQRKPPFMDDIKGV
jgi:hypothetical protein